MVLTNHLARAIDTAGSQDNSGNDILHNVLSLLLNLSRYFKQSLLFKLCLSLNLILKSKVLIIKIIVGVIDNGFVLFMISYTIDIVTFNGDK